MGVSNWIVALPFRSKAKKGEIQRQNARVLSSTNHKKLQDTYSVSKSIKLWSTAGCAGTSPEATEKEQRSIIQTKNAPKIYNH